MKSQNPQSHQRRQCGFLVILFTVFVIVWGGLAYLGVQYFIDRSDYHEGHQAHQKGDCEGAISHYNQIIDRLRFVDLSDYATLSRQKKNECLLGIANDKQQSGDFQSALNININLVRSENNQNLVEAARNNISVLFGQVDPALLAGKDTCPNIDLLIELNLIPQPDTKLPFFYLACGQVYWQESSNYSTAIELYNLLTDRYAHTEAATTASQALPQIYIKWGQDLFTNEAYLEAMDKFTQVKELTADPNILATAQEEYDNTALTVSQDTGALGQKLIREAWDESCKNKPVTSPTVGLVQNEPPKAWFGGNKFRLPDELQAIYPDHFRYAVCFNQGVKQIEYCTYGIFSNGGSVTRQQSWWRIAIWDTSTGKVVDQHTFDGPRPEACPELIEAGSRLTFTGDEPSTSEVFTWIQAVVQR